MNSGKETHHFLESMDALRRKKSELPSTNPNRPIQFVLCTHVLPDGIGDLVHLKDFADHLETMPDTQITRVAFVLESDMEKAASILEIEQSKNYYVISYRIDEKDGTLVLTDTGKETLKQFQERGILEHSDYRVQISAPLQIKDKNSFLSAQGIFSPQDWLSFFEIRPGVYEYQTKPYSQGLIYMGLDKNKKESGIKLNATIHQLCDDLEKQKTSRSDIVNKYIKNPLINKTVSEAISQNSFIATGYLHTQLTKQAYLTWISHISEQKNILITSNQITPAALKDMDLTSLSEAGIGQIVFHNTDGNDSIIKIGEGQRQIDVLQMKDCTNEEINALFAIANTTCAAGDTSIGQVMSSLALPFFDVVDNKRYFFDTQFLRFIQNFSDHQPLYDYLEACVHLVSENGINQDRLQRMVEITQNHQATLLNQWQQITATIQHEYNAYDGLLEFIEENTLYQFFASASQALSSNLNGQHENIFLLKYQLNFFNYLIYTEKTGLLSSLLENQKFDPSTVLNVFEEKNHKIFKLIFQAEERLLVSILQNLDPFEQQKLLSQTFLYGALNGSNNLWIKDKFTQFVDCRSLEQFDMDLSMGLDEGFVIALCKKALEENDEAYFRKLPSGTLYTLQQILPDYLVPSGIQNILKTGISEDYFAEDYDLAYPESMDFEPPPTSEVRGMRQSALNALLNPSISNLDKEDLASLLDQPFETIYEESFAWLKCDLYEPHICQEVVQILTEYAYVRFEEQTLQDLLSFPISDEDKQELIVLLEQPVEEIKKEATSWRNTTFYNKDLGYQIADTLKTFAQVRAKQQTINTFFNLPISDVDKQELILILNETPEMIKKEALLWSTDSLYGQSLNKHIAETLNFFADVMLTEKLPLPFKVYSHHHSSLFFNKAPPPSVKMQPPDSPEKKRVLQTIQTLPISTSDKEQLIKVLDKPKESILAEASIWHEPGSFYEKDIEKNIAELLLDYADQLDEGLVNKKR
ncbi:Uncharacterised protein [Legionella wadsworthii]|uniref:Uncharacterized protein n=1 Tax=Legionella wadsworthii TaxID=28088 RepID=A0A378LNC1_9GAMM|nr:hypothetical protein [Legionella wadsworthii]STY28253.1 Uncharacterised protein [Legionella wadsworthii]